MTKAQTISVKDSDRQEALNKDSYCNHTLIRRFLQSSLSAVDVSERSEPMPAC